MKRAILIVDLGHELKQHIENQAVKKKVDVSKYVRAALKKVSKFKEKQIV